MNCKKCGNLLNENEKFCTNCGEPVDTMVNSTMPSQPTPNTSSQSTQNFDSSSMVQNNVQAQMQPEMSNNLNQGFNNQNIVNSNMNQQIQNQNNNTTNQSTGGNNNFKTILIVLIVIAIGIGGFIAYKTLSKNNEESNNSSSSNTSITTDTPATQVDDSNRYDYNGFQFIIPEGYTASEYNGGLLLKGSKANVVFAIIDYYTLEDVTASIDSVKSTYTSSGFTIKYEDQRTYNGKEWLLLPSTITQDGQSRDLTIAYTDLGQYHLIEALVIITGDFVDDDKIYTELSKMFNSATYNGSSSFSQNGEKEKFNPTIKFNESLANFEE